MFSRSSNLYGALEHPMVAAYLGGLSLAIEKGLRDATINVYK